MKHRRSPYCPQTPALHPSVPPAPLLLSPKIRSKGQQKKGGGERKKKNQEEEEKRTGAERSQSCGGRRGGRGAKRRHARSDGPKKGKNQKVTQKPKATSTATSSVWVTEPQRNQIQTKRGRGGRGEERGEDAPPPILSVRPSFSCDCRSCIDRRTASPPVLRQRPRLCSHWMDKIWNNLNKLYFENIYIFCFCFPLCVCLWRMDLSHCFLLIMRREGLGGTVGDGLGDVLPVFISSCLFGCSLGCWRLFSFFF